MVLANVATVLAQWGYRVLVVDLDLEAPGLEFYFRPYLRNDRFGYDQGALDLLNGSIRDWQSLVHSVRIPENEALEQPPILDIMYSGSWKSDDYASQLCGFNIDEFYSERNGALTIESLRDSWKEHYDFVLVDSRTGVTDIGGICTIQLPDILLTLFAPTEQGWLGARDVALKAVRNQGLLPFERDRLLVLPVPTRIDHSEKALTESWLGGVAKEWEPIAGHWVESEVNILDLVRKVAVPYVPYFNFGESLAVVNDTSSPGGLGYAMSSLAALVAEGLDRSLDFVESRDAYVQGAIERAAITCSARAATSPPPARDEVRQLFEASMFVVGEAGAGKTTLIRRLLDPEHPSDPTGEATLGIDVYRYWFDRSEGGPFRLNLWDFGGQEILRGTAQLYFREKALYLVVVDTRRGSERLLSLWLQEIHALAPASPILVFLNDRGRTAWEVSESSVRRRYPNVLGFYRGDLQDRNAVTELRCAVQDCALSLPDVGLTVPARWFSIRADLEALATDRSFISLDLFTDIYCRHLKFNYAEIQRLSRFLHDRGVILHFQDDPNLRGIVVLRPGWATEAMFRILNDEAIKSQRGRFSLEDCARLWASSAYANGHLDLLLALMEKFELCYRLENKQPETWFAPLGLCHSTPEYVEVWAAPSDLVLSYRYEFLPRGLVGRLMVRMHRFIVQPELSWADGVLFERQQTQLLVRAMDRGDEITLRARGPESTALLDVIASALDSLNDSVSAGKVSKWVACACSKCRSVTTPELFELSRLLSRKHNNKIVMECPESYEDVSVLGLLDGLRVKQVPSWAKGSPPADSDAILPHLARVEVRPPPERAIKIFLASSEELRADRDGFDLYFRQQNDLLRKRGLYLEIVRWENSLDAISETRLQDEYNAVVRACDIFVCLFMTKTGKYTEEGFDVAHQAFAATGKPLVFTFFKQAQVSTTADGLAALTALVKFQEKLANLGHFYTTYESAEHLKRLFKDQLEKLEAKMSAPRPAD